MQARIPFHMRGHQKPQATVHRKYSNGYLQQELDIWENFRKFGVITGLLAMLTVIFALSSKHWIDIIPLVGPSNTKGAVKQIR